LYPGDIKGIYKMRGRFIELEKILMKKGFPLSGYYFLARKQRIKSISEKKN
jgi:hypothetical protein